MHSLKEWWNKKSSVRHHIEQPAKNTALILLLKEKTDPLEKLRVHLMFLVLFFTNTRSGTVHNKFEQEKNISTQYNTVLRSHKSSPVMAIIEWCFKAAIPMCFPLTDSFGIFWEAQHGQMQRGRGRTWYRTMTWLSFPRRGIAMHVSGSACDFSGISNNNKKS